MKEVNGKRYYTTKQVAEAHFVTERTVRNWIKRGLLPGAVRPPGTRKWLIPAQRFTGGIT